MEVGVVVAACTAVWAAARAADEVAPTPDAELGEVPVVEDLLELDEELQAARTTTPTARMAAPYILLGLIRSYSLSYRLFLLLALLLLVSRRARASS
jgi:hypothetical protein